MKKKSIVVKYTKEEKVIRKALYMLNELNYCKDNNRRKYLLHYSLGLLDSLITKDDIDEQ